MCTVLLSLSVSLDGCSAGPDVGVGQPMGAGGERLHQAAGDKDVLLMGGASIAQQFVRAGLVDEIQLQLVPVLLGNGSRPFAQRGAPPIALASPTVTASAAVTHLRYRVIK